MPGAPFGEQPSLAPPGQVVGEQPSIAPPAPPGSLQQPGAVLGASSPAGSDAGPAGQHVGAAAPQPGDGPIVVTTGAESDAADWDAASGQVDEHLEQLRRRVRRKRRRSVLLANGAVVAAALGLVCWGAYYATSTLTFARVKNNIQLLRDPADDERLVLLYEPLSQGRIGFRRADADRETELIDRVLPEEVGGAQRFEWRIQGLAAGEVIKVTSLRGWGLETTELRVPPPAARGAAAPQVSLGSAVLNGRIVNAIDNRPVAGAQVRVLGTPLAAQTDENGDFRISGVPDGELPIEVSADGFTSEQFERRLVSSTDTPLRVALSPGMQRGQMRIVLTWEDPSLDLDAHLEGPLPEGRRFHVYYHEPGDLHSREFVRLDTDARKDGGPETITVLGVLPGTYRYWVHDYTHGDQPQTNALARSGAEVKLYQGGQTYRFRAGHEMTGNVWDVCTIEVTPEAAVVQKVDEYRSLGTEALGLYAKRTLANRQQWIGRYGGTPISEQAVSEGLEWLARHQAPDGSWGPYCLGPGGGSQCEKPDVCTGEGEPYEMALTGLALLAFQAGGHYYFNNTAYSETVRKGLDWIVARQKPDGALVGSKPKGGYPRYHKYHMYEHGIAAFALADACAAARALGREVHEPYLKATQQAVRFIEANQHTDGGWRYTPDLKRPGDSSVTGWQVLALKSAREAGLDVSPKCIEKIRLFFKYRETGEYGRTGYDDRIPQTDATTGVGMLARQFLLGEPDAPLIHEAAAYLADLAEIRWGDRRADEATCDYYLWYNCTLAMFQVGGEHWQRWNDLVRDTIIGLQRHDGCERGSWDPISRWGRFGGRIYSTALATLTLETYYRYTPQRELDPGVVELHTSPAPQAPQPGAGAVDDETGPAVILPSRGDSSRGDDKPISNDESRGDGESGSGDELQGPPIPP